MKAYGFMPAAKPQASNTFDISPAEGRDPKSRKFGRAIIVLGVDVVDKNRCRRKRQMVIRVWRFC
jgi:hypothetical protein